MSITSLLHAIFIVDKEKHSVFNPFLDQGILKSADNFNFIYYGLSHSSSIIVAFSHKDQTTCNNLFSDLYGKVVEASMSNQSNSVLNVTYVVSDLNVLTKRMRNAVVYSDSDLLIVETPLVGFYHTFISSTSSLLQELDSKFDRKTLLPSLFQDIDHLALAIAPDEVSMIERFYLDVLQLNIVPINGSEDGFSIMVNKRGMQMKAVEWEVESDSTKIVFCHSLSEAGLDDQITIFRNNFGLSGVQHIALSCKDIVTTCSILKRRGVDFLSIPNEYYSIKTDVIERNNLIADEMSENGILISEDTSNTSSYLLQTFSKPLFPGTFFFEVIERLNGSRSFGTDNIKCLWSSK